MLYANISETTQLASIEERRNVNNLVDSIKVDKNYHI